MFHKYDVIFQTANNIVFAKFIFLYTKIKIKKRGKVFPQFKNHLCISILLSWFPYGKICKKEKTPNRICYQLGALRIESDIF